MFRPFFTPCAAALLWVGLALSAHAQTQASEAPETVRICDDSGCADRPSDSATFDTPANAAAAPSAHLQALINKAESNPRAAYDLGLRYFRGDGVARDSYQALQWLRKAGDGGLMPAQLALGRLYLNGLEEMGSDPGEAESWLEKAAASGSGEAKKLLPQARKAKQGEQAAYAEREKDKNTWYILWSQSAPYYWHWQGQSWICHSCR